MKEKIFTIPVNDAFDSDCECPVCKMRDVLEKEAVEYAMGPSYMESDIREKTDAMGFCEKHIKAVYDVENRLGFALVMKTHMDKIISDVEKMPVEPVRGKTIFSKVSAPEVTEYTKKLACSCYVCDRVENTFKRYIDTIIYLYKHDKNFKEKYRSSKGFCINHYGVLIEAAACQLKGAVLEEFVCDTKEVFIDNMKRVRDDVAWFVNKFDHKYADEPWKNAKDSLPRAMIKTSSYLEQD